MDYFEYEGIQIPSEVEVNNTDNDGWVHPLFKLLAERTESPSALWDFILGTLFLDEKFTEKHRYAICINFSALIVSMFMEQEYGNALLQLQQDLMANREEANLIVY